VPGVLLREPFKRVDRTQSHSGLLVAQLLNRLVVLLGDPTLRAVDCRRLGHLSLHRKRLLGRALAPRRKPQCEQSAGSGTNAEPDTHDVEQPGQALRVGVVGQIHEEGG
jgi:hypothetical protein